MKSQSQLNFINFVVPKFMFEKEKCRIDNLKFYQKQLLAEKITISYKCWMLK